MFMVQVEPQPPSSEDAKNRLEEQAIDEIVAGLVEPSVEPAAPATAPSSEVQLPAPEPIAEHQQELETPTEDTQRLAHEIVYSFTRGGLPLGITQRVGKVLRAYGFSYDEIYHQRPEELLNKLKDKLAAPGAERPAVTPERDEIEPAEQERQLEEFRQRYLDAKAGRRSVGAGVWRKKLTEKEIRELGEQYEQAVRVSVIRDVKEALGKLKEGGEFTSKTPDYINEVALRLINTAYSREVDLEGQAIEARYKGRGQKFKEWFMRHPYWRMSIGAGLTATGIVSAKFGLFGVSEAALYAKTLMSGVGTGMASEAFIAGKQEKGRVGAIARAARRERDTLDEMRTFIKSGIDGLSSDEVVHELARLRNVQESKGTKEIKGAIQYGRMIELWGVLFNKASSAARKGFHGEDNEDVAYAPPKALTKDLTREAVVMLEQRYKHDVAEAAKVAVTQAEAGAVLTPEKKAEVALAYILEQQKKFNQAQESNLDCQHKQAVVRVVISLTAGGAVGAGTYLLGLARLEQQKVTLAPKPETAAPADHTATTIKAPWNKGAAPSTARPAVGGGGSPQPSEAEALHKTIEELHQPQTGPDTIKIPQAPAAASEVKPATVPLTKVTTAHLPASVTSEEFAKHGTDIWTPEHVTAGHGGSYWSTFQEQYHANPEYFGYHKTSGLTVDEYGRRLVVDYAKSHGLVQLDAKGNVVSDVRLKGPDAKLLWHMKNGQLDLSQEQASQPVGQVETYIHHEPPETTKLPSAAIEPAHEPSSAETADVAWAQTIKADHLVEVAPGQAPYGFVYSTDVHLYAVDPHADGLTDAYRMYDDQHEVVTAYTKLPNEDAEQFLTRVAVDHQKIVNEVNEVGKALGGQAKSWTGADKLIASREFGLHYEPSGELSPSSKGLLREAIEKMGDQATKYLRDQDFASYVREHLSTLSPNKVGEMYSEGAVLQEHGWHSVDYNFLDRLHELKGRSALGYNWTPDHIVSKFASPFTNTYLSSAFEHRGAFNAQTLQEVNSHIQDDFARLMHEYKGLQDWFGSRLGESALAKAMKLPVSTSLDQWNAALGGRQHEVVEALYHKFDAMMGGKLSGGGLQNTVGENLESTILHHTIPSVSGAPSFEHIKQAEELLNQAELIQRQNAAESLLKQASRLP